MKTYASTRKERPRAPRGRAVSANNSPLAPSEGPTVVSAPDHGADEEKTPKSHSQPASPTLPPTPADGTISRASSLGQSLSALVMMHRRTARTPAASNSPSVVGSADGQLLVRPNVSMAPLADMPDRMASVQEVEASHIPDAQEKSGPDISQSPEGEEQKKDRVA